MLSYRDGYYWNTKERRESGEDKREFEELLKQDWLEFDLCSQWFECRMILCAEPGGRSRSPAGRRNHCIAGSGTVINELESGDAR